MTMRAPLREVPATISYLRRRKIDYLKIICTKNIKIDCLLSLERRKYQHTDGGLIDFYAIWDLAHTLVYLFENKYCHIIFPYINPKSPEKISPSTLPQEEILKNSPFQAKNLADKALYIHRSTLKKNYREPILDKYFQILSSTSEFKETLTLHPTYEDYFKIEYKDQRGKNIYDLFFQKKFTTHDIYTDNISNIINSFLDEISLQLSDLYELLKLPKGGYVDKAQKNLRISNTLRSKNYGEEILRNRYTEYIKSLPQNSLNTFESIDSFLQGIDQIDKLSNILDEYQKQTTDECGRVITYGKPLKFENLPRKFKQWAKFEEFSTALSRIVQSKSSSKKS